MAAASQGPVDPTISNDINRMAREMEAFTQDYTKNERFVNDMLEAIELQENMRNMTLDSLSVEELKALIINERQERRADLYRIKPKIVDRLNEFDVKTKTYHKTLDNIAMKIMIMESELQTWKDKFHRVEEYNKDLSSDARDFSEQIESLIRERDALRIRLNSIKQDPHASPIRIIPGYSSSYEETRPLWDVRDRLKDSKTIPRNLYEMMIRFTTEGPERKIGNDDIPTRREKIIKAFEGMLNNLTCENRQFPRDEATFNFVAKKIKRVLKEDTGKMYISVEMIKNAMNQPEDV
jgi:hypothetical protein